MTIHYCNEDVSLPKIKKRKITNWIKKTIVNEEKIPGVVSFIFCSDKYLLEVNRKYLEHDYFTDVITFDYVEGNIISGDIFISCERVEENALEYKTGYENELLRILIHGVLHLLGYKDKTKKDKLLMTKKENFYLEMFSNV